MLATMAVLKGVGVGDSNATPLAATLTWMLKGIIEAMKRCTAIETTQIELCGHLHVPI